MTIVQTREISYEMREAFISFLFENEACCYKVVIHRAHLIIMRVGATPSRIPRCPGQDPAWELMHY